MSWSIYTVGLPADIAGRVDALEPPYVSEPEREEQVSTAKATAKALIASGAVGAGPAFSVTLSGHANPSHEAAPGYASDCVSVHVSQSTEQVVEQFDAAMAQAQVNAQ